jgi:hypothetical protein
MSGFARLHLAALAAALALTAACAPGESQDSPDDVETRGLPLSAAIATAESPHGLVVGGVSLDEDRFWEAWLLPADGTAPRRLAPVGNALVGVTEAGAVWTDLGELDAGLPTYEMWLSPADGSAAVPLAVDLPTHFEPALAVRDGEGWLLAGTDELGGARRGCVYAAGRGQGARLLATIPGEPLFLSGFLGQDSLTLEIQQDPEGAPERVTVPRR